MTEAKEKHFNRVYMEIRALTISRSKKSIIMLMIIKVDLKKKPLYQDTCSFLLNLARELKERIWQSWP